MTFVALKGGNSFQKNSFKKGNISVGTCEEIGPWPTGLVAVEQTSCQGHVLAH
jgi:hypothetical protein